MRGQAVGQRLAAFEHAQNILHQHAEGLARSVSSLVMESARSSGTPALSSVESSCVKNRTSLLLAAGERGQLQLERFLRFGADVNRRQALAAQFLRHPAFGLGMNGAGAKLAIGSDGSEVEVSHLLPAPSGARILRGARTLACRVHTRVNARFSSCPAHY